LVRPPAAQTIVCQNCLSGRRRAARASRFQRPICRFARQGPRQASPPASTRAPS
jgi:hypothetical protein